MRKSLAAALAAVTFGGAIVSVAAPAQAQDYYQGYSRSYGDYGRSHHNNSASTAVIAGIAGLAIGAALASSSQKNRNAYSGSYYDPRYRSGYNGYAGDYRSGYDDDDWGATSGYGQSYGYSSGYSICELNQLSYDPYSGRQVIVQSRYAC